MNRLLDAKFSTYLKYIAITTSTGTVCLLVSMYWFRYKFQSAGYFKKTLKIVEENKNVEKLLGRPIKFGKLYLGDTKTFYATPEKAFVTVGTWGPLDSGLVTSYCLRTPPPEKPADDEADAEEYDDGIPNDGWEVMRVELQVKKHKDKRLVVFRKPEADEEFVKTFHDFIEKEAN